MGDLLEVVNGVKEGHRGDGLGKYPVLMETG